MVSDVICAAHFIYLLENIQGVPKKPVYFGAAAF